MSRSQGGGVAWVAHIGGFIAGVLLGSCWPDCDLRGLHITRDIRFLSD
jgi:membrane associated rhomboid family serine protease